MTLLSRAPPMISLHGPPDVHLITVKSPGWKETSPDSEASPLSAFGPTLMNSIFRKKRKGSTSSRQLEALGLSVILPGGYVQSSWCFWGGEWVTRELGGGSSSRNTWGLPGTGNVTDTKKNPPALLTLKRTPYRYRMEYYSATNKNEIFAICNNMDGLGGHYAKWNNSGRERYCMLSLICGI